MLTSYLRMALRSMRKRTGYTLLNLLGLVIGIAASILILRYVTHELSYDDFHADADRIYRVQYDFYRNGEQVFQSATAFPKVGPAMLADFPEVEAYARLFLHYGGGVVRVGDRSFKEDFVFQADPSLLTLFGYPMQRGDPETALAEPNTAVISEAIARKYFGDEDPVGKRFIYGNDLEYVITGVIASPENSHLKFNLLLSYSTLVQAWGSGFDEAWGWYDFYNYIRLAPGTDPAALAAKLPAFIERHGGEGSSERVTFQLQPLQDIHLYSDLIQEARVNGDGQAVYFLMIVAFFILIIAWVNYINLATARAVERAKEIGIRKAVGAHRGQLVGQYLLESVVLNVIAAGLAIGLAWLVLPMFNNLMGTVLTFDVTGQPTYWVALVAVFLAGAILSGLYPALVLSSYRPVQVLKGAFAQGRQGVLLRKGLVVAQFVASVALIAGTLIVYQQLSFMRGQDLGIDIDQTLVVEGPGVLASDSLYASQMSAFKEAVLTRPAVRGVAASTEIPGNLIYWTNGAFRLGAPPESRTIMYKVGIDYDFLDAFGHELVAGRGYNRDFTADDASVVLNERATDVLGFASPEAALDEPVVIGSDTLTVVGVIANHHQEGLHKAYDQIAYLLRPDARSYYTLKVQPADVGTTLAFIEEQYRSAFPNNPFTYYFLDSYFDRQYQNDRRFGQVFGFFALLAIAVACLGLFGLSSFTAAQRTKEIGIRKVLGSSVSGILLLLSKDFLQLVLIGSVIAVPIVWFVMERWLEGFAFRIDISLWVFLAATVLTFLIAIATVSYQSARAALLNPSDALRYE